MDEYLIKANLSEKLSDFNDILDSGLNLHTFEIDCSKIEKFGELIFDKRKESILGNLYETLDNLSNSCLYWFEYDNEEDAKNSENEYIVFKNEKSIHLRSSPALNKNKDSKYFYVGVRKGGKRKKDGFTNIAGRIYQHLGCYRHGSTSALQLIHWSSRKIKLSVLELPKGSSDYLYILEKFYALKLKPLIGQH